MHDARTGRFPRCPLALALLAALACAGAPPRPDVLLFVIDTLRADGVGYAGDAGDPEAETPNLDALAADALVFEQAFAHASWTRSSMATLLTGTLPAVHATEGRDDHLPADLAGLADWLGAAGYTTAFVTANPNVGSFYGFGRGFDAMQELYERRAPGLVHNEELAVASGEVVDRAIAWLDATPRPIFLVVHTIDPHWPYASAPADLPESGYRAAYRREISANDASLGRLIDHLREGGRLDDTLIVVTADHGEEFWEHGDFGHGRTLYEEVLHVPLVVRLPASRTRPAPARIARSVGLVDIAPTILDALALPAPPQLAGRSLLADPPDEDAPLVACLRLDGHRLRSARAWPWKLIVDDASGVRRLERLDDAGGEARAIDPDDASDPAAAAARNRLLAALAEKAPLAPGARDVAAPGPTPPDDVRGALERLGYLEASPPAR